METQKICYATRSIETEAGHQYMLTYAITVDEIDILGSIMECYGIEIHMTGDNTDNCRAIRAITANADEIERIADLLCRGIVFPADLEETLENLLP